MLDGFHLSLMVGPAVPAPAPREVLDALQSVQVTSSSSGPSGFQLSFAVPKRSPLQTMFLLAGGAGIPLVRVVLTATIQGTPEVLIDGVMTHHEITPGQASGPATLTVSGRDLTAVMDLVDFSGLPYPAMPTFARVGFILLKYAALGVIPLVIPTVLPDVPNPIEMIPRHLGSDLAYIRQLAEEAGHVFCIEPGPAPGASVAYWGPEIRPGPPQPALNADMDAHTNVESLSFRFDSESRTLPVLFVHNELTKVPIPIPVPDIGPLSPPLGLIPPIPHRVEPIVGTAKLSPAQAALLGLARASRSNDAVTASGSLDVIRYGRPLKARRLVGVRGVGEAFDGLYHVRSVTHKIRRGEYKQDFTLARNGLLSTVPRVPA